MALKSSDKKSLPLISPFSGNNLITDITFSTIDKWVKSTEKIIFLSPIFLL